MRREKLGQEFEFAGAGVRGLKRPASGRVRNVGAKGGRMKNLLLFLRSPHSRPSPNESYPGRGFRSWIVFAYDGGGIYEDVYAARAPEK
jgi:hypothetical protein